MAVKNDLRMLKEYSNKWVALSSDSKKIVGVGSTVKEAVKKAEANKEHNPILTKTPECYGTFVL